MDGEGADQQHHATACPECGCRDVLLVTHPHKKTTVRLSGLTLVQCTACSNHYAISSEDALGLPADDSPGKTIEESLPCAVCGYDVRTLRVGGKCPECGTEIPGRKALAVARAGRQAKRWNWAWIVFVTAWLAPAIFPDLRRLEYVLYVMGVGAVAFGAKGVVTRTYKTPADRWPLKSPPPVYGVWAMIWSSLYLLIGLSLIVCTTLAILGIIR